jgi:hypothetical protein
MTIRKSEEGTALIMYSTQYQIQILVIQIIFVIHKNLRLVCHYIVQYMYLTVRPTLNCLIFFRVRKGNRSTNILFLFLAKSPLSCSLLSSNFALSNLLLQLFIPQKLDTKGGLHQDQLHLPLLDEELPFLKIDLEHFPLNLGLLLLLLDGQYRDSHL